MPVVPTYNTQFAKYGIRVPVAVASTAANLPNYGVTVINTTKHFTLDQPEVGVQKTIVNLGSSAGSTKAAFVSTNSTTTLFQGSTTNTLEFDLLNEAVTLVGYTTAAWLVESNTGGVTFSASTGAP